MVIYVERGADLFMPSWCHCHSLSLVSVESRLVLHFWYWLTRVVLDKGPLNRFVCVPFLYDRLIKCVLKSRQKLCQLLLLLGTKK